MVREVKSLRAKTKNFTRLFSGKYEPQFLLLWFVFSETAPRMNSSIDRNEPPPISGTIASTVFGYSL
ncbi:DUF1661 domain-containing protein [Porphyromonas gulae]|uniref:DUF1661 domain-containing protein n=1 Tax=Porphyromonas gulae TaxID=111105 RepID=UPI001F43CD69|nr:DUF1661 domain-containing protein [Porphyromonas gulae]